MKGEGVWETRFLAPATMKDGVYYCTLLMTDEKGSIYRENKKFTIDCKPPSMKIQLDRKNYVAGESVEVLVFADRDTRSIFLHLDDFTTGKASYVTDRAGSVGVIKIPSDYLPGTYQLRITAVDFARNTSVKNVELVIMPRGGEEQ